MPTPWPSRAGYVSLGFGPDGWYYWREGGALRASPLPGARLGGDHVGIAEGCVYDLRALVSKRLSILLIQAEFEAGASGA